MLELRGVCFAAGQDAQEKAGLQKEGLQKEILQNVNLKLADNRFVVLTGPNGSGKTTLAKLIMGIIRPSSGQILFQGEDITGLGVTERAQRGISFAFQQPVRFKGITVADLISLAAGGAAGSRLSTAEVCSYLSEVGLCARDYVNREVDAKLSGGELKRIELAGILARFARQEQEGKSALAIFDEPEAGIDLWSFNNLIEVFANMRERPNAGILVISHQERILAIADEIVVFSQGTVANRGSREEILPTLLNVDYKYSACRGGKRDE